MPAYNAANLLCEGEDALMFPALLVLIISPANVAVPSDPNFVLKFDVVVSPLSPRYNVPLAVKNAAVRLVALFEAV